ncbi:MAG: RsmB/NOP family class I SAM-dependent RNA methyltransferase [Lentisphaeria bacterium]|nr:RsmB/NOP family class I SAM-dependent RNA methyltransferase [Lentisphaeria bacterium]
MAEGSIHHSGASFECVLENALNALKRMRQENLSLDEYLDDFNADMVMRRRVASLLFIYFRRKNLLENAILPHCRKKPERSLLDMLSLALAAAHYQDALATESVVNIAVELCKKLYNIHTAKFVNALMHKALESIGSTAASPLPSEIYSRWRKRFGNEKTSVLGELFTAEAVPTVRLRSGFEVAEESFEPVEATETPWKFFCCRDLGSVLKSENFARGAYYIQDIAPALVCGLLAKHRDLLPGEAALLDLCAAPGGKLIMNMELLQDLNCRVKRAVAIDRSARRLKLVKSNLQRCGVASAAVAADASDGDLLAGEKFEVVTCDVPCSNSGVFRRRPDALHRWNSAELKKIVPLQKSILENAARLTAEKGLILYSTCSLEPEENQQVISAFLQNHPEFELIEEQLFMPQADCDGTFGALLYKRSVKN